jgi:hypothetical protein
LILLKASSWVQPVGAGSGISVTLSSELGVFLISQGIKAPVMRKMITILSCDDVG